MYPFLHIWILHSQVVRKTSLASVSCTENSFETGDNLNRTVVNMLCRFMISEKAFVESKRKLGELENNTRRFVRELQNGVF